jgi:ectoine hydroxylase
MDPNTLDSYYEHGYATLPQAFWFSDDHIKQVMSVANRKIQDNHPGNVKEDDSNSIRAIHGFEYDHILDKIEELRSLACEIINCKDAYVYQYRINIKKANTGKSWKPHRDYDFWHAEDGMPKPDAVLFHVCLNDHVPENSPIHVVPGSHKWSADVIENASKDKAWKQCFCEKELKYQVELDMSSYSTQALVGKQGAMYIMNPLLWHLSYENTSNSDRVLLSIIFNSTDNIPTKLDSRPSYIAQKPPDSVTSL